MFLTHFYNWKLKKCVFWDLNLPKCGARSSGRSYDTPSSPKPKFLLVFDDLVLKSENLHAGLDWEVMFLTEFYNWTLEKIAFWDLNLPTCRARVFGRDYDTPSSPKHQF